MEPTTAERIRSEARAATRRALLEAGLAELIARGGLETPTVEAVCSRAGYTRGAFYFYFEDRAQFLAEMLEWVLTDVIGALFARAREAPEAEGVRGVVTRFTEALASGDWPDLHGNIRAGYLAIMRGVSTGGGIRDRHTELMSLLIERLEAGITEGQRRGELRPEIDPHQTATAITLVAIGAVLWDGIGIPVDPRTLGASVMGLLELPPSGDETLDLTHPDA